MKETLKEQISMLLLGILVVKKLINEKYFDKPNFFTNLCINFQIQ